MKKLVKILGTIIFSLIIIIAIGGYLFVRNFDLNRYKSYVEDVVYNQLGRKLAIKGDASVGISLIPTLVVEDVELENAPWAAQPQMLKVQRLEIRLSLLPLLQKQVVIDNVRLEGAEVYLETAADGKNNWDFGSSTAKINAAKAELPDNASLLPQKQELINKTASKTANPAAAIIAGFAAKNVSIVNGVAQYIDAKVGKTTEVVLKSFNLKEASMNDEIAMNFEAVLNGQVVKGKTVLGSLNMLLGGEAPYPFDVNVSAYGVDLALWGTARDLFGEPTYAAEVNVYNPAGNMGAPETTLQALIKGSLKNVEAEIKTLNIVNNLITGRVEADVSGKLPSLNAVLRSDKINLQNFSSKSNFAMELPLLIGSAEASPLVPDTLIPYDVMKQLNAKLDLKVKKLVIDAGMSADNVLVNANLQNGLLKVNPFQLNFGGGYLDGSLMVNANDKTLKLDVTSSNIQLQNLHQEFKVAGAGDFGILSGGNIDLKIMLTAGGNSYRQLVRSLSGQVIGIVNESVIQTGSVSFLTGNFVSQLLNMMPFVKSSNQKMELACAVVRADLGGGKAVFPKGIALQSNLLKLVSNGSVNLINDKLDFDIRPFSGKIVDTNAVQALSSFIKVKGTIENPKIALDDKAALKSVVGVALTGPAYLGTKLVNADPAPCYTALQGTLYQNKFPAPTAAEKAATGVYNGAENAVNGSVKAVKSTIKGTAKELENTAKGILNMLKQPKEK